VVAHRTTGQPPARHSVPDIGSRAKTTRVPRAEGGRFAPLNPPGRRRPRPASSRQSNSTVGWRTVLGFGGRLAVNLVVWLLDLSMAIVLGSGALTAISGARTVPGSPPWVVCAAICWFASRYLVRHIEPRPGALPSSGQANRKRLNGPAGLRRWA